MTEYVLGFCFTEDYSGARRVMLIRKNKPEWQCGKLNGLGGKVEYCDRNEFDAMRREFLHESGIETQPYNWLRFSVLKYDNALVHCFTTYIEWKRFKHCHRMCDEGEIVSFHHDESFFEKLRDQVCIPDLHWLIPMAHTHRTISGLPVLVIRPSAISRLSSVRPELPHRESLITPPLNETLFTDG